MPRGAFWVHLADAMVINAARKPVYAAMTGGRSARFSTALIAFERATLPLAWWLDRRAAPFQARGIPIIEADFLPMSEIPPAETPPRYRRVALPSEREEADGWLRRVGREARRAVRAKDLAAAARVCADALEAIDLLEARTETHHAMAKHFVESVGFSALHGIDYARRSAGETLPLSLEMVRTQTVGLPFASAFDRYAQPLHALGCGIVVNDVPAIPFLDEWRRATARGA